MSRWNIFRVQKPTPHKLGRVNGKSRAEAVQRAREKWNEQGPLVATPTRESRPPIRQGGKDD